jgi:hypothetical protein
MAKRSMDTISTVKKQPQSEGNPPVVETITPHGAPTKVEQAQTPPESTESYDSMFPEPTVSVNPPPTWTWWLGLLIASVVIGFVGYKTANSQINNWLAVSPSPESSASTEPTPDSESTATPEATSTPTASATPSTEPTSTPQTTATPAPNATITLRVLNGTTVTGAAAKTRTVLTSAGFKVKSIGNATNRNYTGTVIYYQSGRKDEALRVQTALSAYETTLEESSIASPDMVLVVTGLK